MRGVEIAERQIKVKTLQDCNTKALLASLGHFQEKFILGLQYRARGAEEQGGRGQGEMRGQGRIIEQVYTLCPMPHN